MRLHYTHHAEHRMKERHIQPSDIEEALQTRGRTYVEQGEPGKSWVWARARNRRIKVLIQELGGEDLLVITAAWVDTE